MFGPFENQDRPRGGHTLPGVSRNCAALAGKTEAELQPRILET
jgi:hypothetical protein